MLHAVLPARQQAHDLVERLSPIQLSALIDLLGSFSSAPTPETTSTLVAAPFSDELNQDAEPRAYSQDSDFWPTGSQFRRGER